MPKPPRCSDQLEADGSESDSKSTDDNVTYSSNASTSGSSSLRGESLSDSENEDDPFDHLDNLRQPMEGQGESCEIRVFDSLVDATGQRLVLQTAQKSDLALGPDREGPAALVLTRVYDRFKRLSRTVLEIRSQYMKEAMRQVIKTYPGLNIDSGGHIVTFDEPRCLFHYRKELEEFASNSDDSKTRRHVKFCLQYMAKTLREDISAYDTMMKGNLNSARPGLDFDRLWMAFKPGDLVFHKVDGDEVISQLVDMRKFSTKAPSTSHWEVAVQRMEWEVTVQRMESNGKVLGYTTVDIVIPSYDGFREFTKLNVFPLDLHQEKERLIQDVLHRSQKFVSLCDLHHCQHDGVADIYPVDMRISYIPQSAKYECFSTRVKIQGPIMVDCTEFNSNARLTPIQFRPGEPTIGLDSDSLARLTEGELLLCPHKVPGYSLEKKRWGLFDVRNISDMIFDDYAFAQLVLSEDKKTLISSMVTTATLEDDHFDDFIKGKGKSLIFLLHGEPGVGKTYTAESIAAFSRRPLFPLGSGALGTTGGEIEAQLNRCLALATRWNALVLIDEADIFMESRGRDDLQRNNVVSVFLRTLEYFNGIMFLTTNRVESIDPAFKSRIHLSITYPALDMDARAKLWTAFISKAYGDKRPSWLDEAFREKLSNAEVNGRQIKNIIRTAYSLAMKKHRKIRPKDLMLALKALQSFEEDFSNAAATRNYAEETSPRTKKRKREE